MSCSYTGSVFIHVCTSLRGTGVTLMNLSTDVKTGRSRKTSESGASPHTTSLISAGLVQWCTCAGASALPVWPQLEREKWKNVITFA